MGKRGDMMDSQPREGRRPKRLVLVLGGARSGKSSYAEALAARMAAGHSVVYVATATAEDDEMRERIARHRAARPVEWVTLEAPTDPAAALQSDAARTTHVILLDCITLLVSNVLLAGPHTDFDEHTLDADAAAARVTHAIDALLAVYTSGDASLVLVSNEVGMGLVPPYPLGRVYRDVLGRVNARLAANADAVVLLVAGLPVELKALADAWERSTRSMLALDET